MTIAIERLFIYVLVNYDFWIKQKALIFVLLVLQFPVARPW